MKINFTLFNMILLLIIIIAIVMIIDEYFFKEVKEGFELTEEKYKNLENKLCSTEYQKQQLKALLVYNYEVFPILDTISKPETEFIYSYIKNSSDKERDENMHISPYTYCISIRKIDGKINSSRFAFGTKKNHVELEKNIKSLSKDIGITDLPNKKDDVWYGVGWDLEDKIIKFYTISKDNKTINCYVYKTERDSKNNIISIKYDKNKKYDVNKEITYMYKDGKTVEQYNNVPKIDNIYYKKYPEIIEIIGDMTKRGFSLDTYSDYNDTLNLYFD